MKIPKFTIKKKSHRNCHCKKLNQFNYIFSWENGENHLLFNIVPPENGIESFNTDRAIIAGSNFDSWTYRTGFDVAIPFMGYLRDAKMDSLSKVRK